MRRPDQDSAHGCYWRAKNKMLHALDQLKLVGVLTGRIELVDVARAELAQLEDELARLVAEREPIPDPPGFELLSPSR